MANVGEMDRYLTLEERTTTSLSTGEELESWEELVKVWGKREEVGQTYVKEDYEEQQKVATGELYWIIWWRDIDPATHRLVDDTGEVYDILGVQEEDMPPGQFNRNRQLRLRCERKDNDE